MNICPIKYKYGKDKEIELFETIQTLVGEPITQTTGRFDNKDYTSDNYYIELKSRRIFDSNKYSHWLVPSCKFKNNDKKLVVFYHWQGDNTLWRYDFNPEDVKEFISKKGPVSNQHHYDIPKRFFTITQN